MQKIDLNVGEERLLPQNGLIFISEDSDRFEGVDVISLSSITFKYFSPHGVTSKLNSRYSNYLRK